MLNQIRKKTQKMSKLAVTAVIAMFIASAVNAQDIIKRKNGDEINAKILEVGTNEVKYKRFDNQSGPTYTILKSEIFSIQYENGIYDFFSDTPNFETPTPTIENKSQPQLTSKKGRVFRDGKVLNNKEIRAIMADNREALDLFNRATKNEGLLTLWACASGGLIGWFGVELLLGKGGEYTAPLFLIGAGSAAILLIFIEPPRLKKIDESVKIFNSGSNKFSDSYKISVSLMPTGVGLNLHF